MKALFFGTALFCFALFTVNGFAQTKHSASGKRVLNNEGNNTYTEQAEQINGVSFKDQGQNIDNNFADNVNQVFSGEVRSFATVTEEEEPNRGRIWSIVGNKSPDISEQDLIGLYYSDDNGATWNIFNYGILAVNQVLIPDQLDVEIVSNKEKKYLYIAYTYATGSYLSGPKKTALLVLNITDGGGAFYYLNFPGAPDNQYYGIRITSDNDKFPQDPSIYLVCTIDSSLANGDIVCMQRSAFIRYPHNFLSDPQVTYRVPVLQKYITVSGAETAKGRSDIVFMSPNVDDKVYYTLSHPNSVGIWINNTIFDGSASEEQVYLMDHTTRITDHKTVGSFDNTFAQIMIVATRAPSHSNEDLVTIKLDMKNGVASQLTVLSTGTEKAVPRNPKIVAPRGGKEDYRISFSINLPSNPDLADSVIFMESIKSPANQWGPPSRISMKTNNNLWRSKYSAVGIKLNSTNNTLVLWGQASVDWGSIANDVWCTYNAGTPTGLEDEVNNPSGFYISQNYPNPFNPTTTINYSVPIRSKVILNVYNVLGNEILTLVDAEKLAGSYEIKFDAAGFSSGVYFYHIQAGPFAETKKMILIR